MAMDANKFITKLKADNTPKDIVDLDEVYREYKTILEQLPEKDRPAFSLNVMCVLCRNLDKAPKWRDSINHKALLVLSIDCVRETRAMEKSDRVKTLACIYHIQRYIVRQNSSVAPELTFKISFMPFELEAKHLLNEYAKTYWNIIVDRLSYIERLRHKIPIIKLLPKLTEDILKVIEIYDTVQFTTNIIVFLIKKLHLLYTEKYSKELNQMYREIFMKISEKDVKVFKKLPEKDIIDIYVKLNECLYVIAENSSRTNFKDNSLDNIVRICISIVGHCPDLFHCFQTFYSNAFCSVLTSNTHLSYSETVLSTLFMSIETAEKLGYVKAMMATYPYINQFLRLYIEYNINNCSIKPWKDTFDTQIQEICLKLIQILMIKLKKCDQLLKCDSCEVKSGLHDSLRLSFLVKNFLTVPITQNLLITTTFPLIYDLILKQYEVLSELQNLGCANYEKCFRKQQTDIHNTAIILNKAQHLDFSLKLFNIYLNYEIRTSEQKNISRALYNKSICELDSKLYEDALLDAFLSLVYAEGLNSDKYMSLVMDIKAKELKADEGEDKNEVIQVLSVIDACERIVDRNLYGDVKPYLRNLKFSELLKHEFTMYAKLWPSVTPIGGVWRSLLQLSEGKYTFTDAEATWALYEVIVETPAVVRTVTNEHFNSVVTELLENLKEKSLSPDLKIVFSSLLFLKTEFELAAASQKYGWKITEPVQNLDIDQLPSNRTIEQEYNATRHAIQAVAVLTELSPDFNIVTNKSCLQNSLRIYEVFVQLHLHLSREMEALQLAHICCGIADCVDDREAYVRNAGVLLQYEGSRPELQKIVETALRYCADVPTDVAVIFICDVSMYYSRRGSTGAAARLVQLAQAQILGNDHCDINMDLATGRLLEAQSQLCALGTSIDTLSSVNGVQRHYLSIATTGSKWLPRRLHSLTVRGRCLRASLRACSVARGLRLWRRARASAAAAHWSASAAGRAALYVHDTDPCSYEEAQIKIDNRLKHILGLQSIETQPYHTNIQTKKEQFFTPKQEVETMLENFVFKKSQSSPSLPCGSVPAFKAPSWLDHRKCDCYACSMPICHVLSCHTSALEASMYFRANEVDIARNYFNGVMKMMYTTEEKFKKMKNRFQDFEGFVVDSVMRFYSEWFREVKIEALIELSFFELKNGDYDIANEHIVEIHEIIQEVSNKNLYLYNDIMNLITCSAQLRKIKKPVDDLEAEFECLRISPVKFTVPPKTPISKAAKPPTIASKIIVKDEELPKKRKVIKLNLDEGDEKEEEQTHFKVPEPIPTTTRHVLEMATPIGRQKNARSTVKTVTITPSTRTSRAVSKTNSKPDFDNFATPKVLLTQPSDESSPKDTTIYCTPKDCTPDQFFTPLTTVKTYTKKSLRLNIVKNLERDFATPTEKKEGKKLDAVSDKKCIVKKMDKKESSTSNDSGKTTLQVPKAKSNVKKSLKRATSPGKLCKEAREVPRNRRLRKPVNFSVDDDVDDKR